MRITKGITKTYEQFIHTKNKEQELLTELYSWMNAQGIDTATIDFADSIGTRIEHNEFDSANQFFEDLKRFVAGEDVGYG